MEVYIPYLIVLILDIVVVVQLRKPRFEMEPITRRERQNKNRNSKSSRFTITTLLIDLIYLIFNFPLIIFNILCLINFGRFYFYIVFFDRCLKIASFVYASCFFLLFLVFNGIFRNQFISLIKLNIYRIKRCFLV